VEVFLLSKNLLTLLIDVPIHGVCALLCLRDARIFDLVLLWGRTRLPAYLTNFRRWQASSYSPLALDLPDSRGRRRVPVVVQISPFIPLRAAVGVGQSQVRQ
jgi:type IV secretion system protein VirB3